MNAMVDDYSQMWALYYDSQLLSHCNAVFPQANFWRFFSLKSEMLRAIAFTLSNTSSDPASFLHAPMNPRAHVADKHWEHWVPFCRSHYLNPFLFDLAHPFPILQVFVTRYRSRKNVPRGQPIRAGAVDDALCLASREVVHTGAREVRGEVVSHACSGATHCCTIIRLPGRWQSDTMIRYLHLQDRPTMRNFTAHMLQQGMYDLIKNVRQQHPQAD
jgi:hypothetical protein